MPTSLKCVSASKNSSHSSYNQLMSSKVILGTIIGFFIFCLTQGIYHQVNTVYSYEDCKFEGNVYRPGGKCKDTTPFVNADINQYPLTCSSPPSTEIKTAYCGEDELPPRITCPVGGGDCALVDTKIDLTKVQLGGLGPDEKTLNNTSPDVLASYYPFMGLADKPLNPNNTPKESYRTFWRLNSVQTQFSAKARLLQKFIYGQGIFINPYYPPINNYEIPYYPAAGLTEGASASNSNSTENADRSDVFGINIGYGHLQPSFCTLSEGRSTVVLLSLTEPNLDQYVNCYGKASELILRITGVEPTVTDDVLRSAGARIASGICGRVPNCKIAFGNEVNSASTEYHCSDTAQKCGAKFASQFSVFKSGVRSVSQVPIGAAALDVYNTDYPYKNFLAGAKPAYDNSDIIFTNIYCLDDDHKTGPCPAVEYGMKEVRSYSGSKPIFITEYGFNPRTKKGLKYWVDWIYNNPPPVPATALTPNLCPDTAKGDWLHLTKGNIYDLTYSTINQESCSSATDIKTLPTFTLLELWNSLPNSLKNYPVSETAYKDYQLMDADLRAKYDALTPFVLDNARSYLVSDYIALRSGIFNTIPDNFRVARENLPYVYATDDVLNEPAFGIVPSLLPSWIDAKRQTQMTSDDIVYPEESWGGFDAFRYRAFVLKMKADLPYGLWVKDGVTGIEGCRIFTEGPTLESPLTYPTPWINLKKPEFEQQVLVPINITPDGTCKASDGSGKTIIKTHYKVEIAADRKTREIGDVVQDIFGRSISVYNNPKQKDISTAISEPAEDGTNTSLYHALIPGFYTDSKTHKDIPMLAKETVQTLDEGKTEIKEKIARVDGEAEVDLCTLRNFWFRSAGQQRGTYGVCQQPDSQIDSPSNNPTVKAASPSGEVKQHLYEPTCGGQLCYDYIINQVTAAPRCQGKYLNPYLAIAISLNEDGGLVSNKQDGTNIKHFGCDPYGTQGIANTVEAKLSCMITTLANDCSKTEAAALSEYGYLSGGNLNNLVGLLGGEFSCNGPYCFPLWVSSSQAQEYGKALRSVLPNQRDLWHRYYSGYINSYK